MLEKSISPSASRCLIQIRAMAGFNEMLSAELAKVHQLLTHSRDAVAIHQLQGRAQTIIELQEAIAKATVT